MDIAGDILKVTTGVTRKWTKQRKAEERSARARYNRRQALYSARTTFTSVADNVIPDAYQKASSGGTLPAHARQIFYAARPLFLELTGEEIKSVYFTQHLLPKYLNENPDVTADWWVVYDARGHLSEPHSDKADVPLGTIEVDEYLQEIDDHVVDHDDLAAFGRLDVAYPTKGPEHRYSAVLFVEKEGFNALFEAVDLADRYDIAIMSTKGQSVVASRKLVDQLCANDVPLLTLHDFDVHGFLIAFNLVQLSSDAELMNRVRYEFTNNINHTDLGLRLADVEKYGLISERVKAKPIQREVVDYLRMTPAEVDFLRKNQRVELNAFSSDKLIEWIEAKLKECGIEKVIPDDDTLDRAWRRAYQIQFMNSQLEQLREQAAEAAQGLKTPKTLRRRIATELKTNPSNSWDRVLAKIAEDAVDKNGEA